MKTLITAFFKIAFSTVMLYAIYFMVFHMDDMCNIYFWWSQKCLRKQFDLEKSTERNITIGGQLI